MTRPTGWGSEVAAGSPWKSLVVTKVTVTSTATLLPTTALPNRRGLLVMNPSVNAKTVFLGDSTVGTSTDFELFAGASQNLPVVDSVSVYGIVSGASVTLVVFEYT